MTHFLLLIGAIWIASALLFLVAFHGMVSGGKR